MKWKNPVEPKIGEKRVRMAYAWYPVRLEDGYTVWLEPYYITERWCFLEFWFTEKRTRFHK